MNLIRKCLTLAVLVLLWRSSSAETLDEIKKAKAEHVQELSRMKMTQPAEYDRFNKLNLIQTKMLLGRLGYDVGPFDLSLNDRVVAAIKAYEKNRGIPITGDSLSFETFFQVLKDHKIINTQHLYPNSFSFGDMFWDKGTVVAQGTWSIVGDSQANPEQVTNIVCHRDDMRCYSATAVKLGDGPNSGLSSDFEMYDVERWDASEIVTKPNDFACARYVYRINRVQKSVTGTRSKISKAKECDPIYNKEITLKLVDGGDVYQELQLQYRREWLGLLQVSPDARAALAE